MKRRTSPRCWCLKMPVSCQDVSVERLAIGAQAPSAISPQIVAHPSSWDAERDFGSTTRPHAWRSVIFSPSVIWWQLLSHSDGSHPFARRYAPSPLHALRPSSGDFPSMTQSKNLAPSMLKRVKCNLSIGKSPQYQPAEYRLLLLSRSSCTLPEGIVGYERGLEGRMILHPRVNKQHSRVCSCRVLSSRKPDRFRSVGRL